MFIKKHHIGILPIAVLFFFLLNLSSALALTSEVNVKDYGAKGDGITDDTRAIQNAINYADSKSISTVIIPDGIYIINPDVSVYLKNNIKLQLSPNTTLKAKPTSSGWNAVIAATQVTNIEVTGGNIVGERDAHLGTKGEWGMGIRFNDSSDIRISDISISNCWGDGIYLGSRSPSGYDSNVIIQNFEIDNCRRNGISVISVKGLTIKNGTIKNINGTNPQCGIDLEPDYITDYMQDVVIENVTSTNNVKYGLLFGYGLYQSSTIPSDITLKKFIAEGNGTGIYNDYTKYLNQYTKINIIE